MKKFMKGCLITALTFAVVGVVFAFVGGRMSDRAAIAQAMDKATNGRIPASARSWWEWLFHMESAPHDHGHVDEIYDDDWDDDWDDDDYDDEPYDNGYGHDDHVVGFKDSYPIYRGNVDKFCLGGDASNLKIDVGGCRFETGRSDDGLFYLEAQNIYKLQGYVEDETLHVNGSSKSPVNWSGTDSVVTLYLPADCQFDEAQIDMGAGLASFEALDAQKASLEIGAGEIVVDKAAANKLEVAIGAGSVSLYRMDIDRLDVEVGMGEFIADGDICESAKIECAMGNVELRLDGSETDYDYSLECAMGNVNLGESSFAGLGQEKRIDNRAAKEMEVECSMGNIDIYFSE